MCIFVLAMLGFYVYRCDFFLLLSTCGSVTRVVVLVGSVGGLSGS